MTEHAMSTRYKCPRCHHPQYDTGEMRAAGGFWSKIFDVQNRRFTTVTCQRCRHTELFAVESSKLGSVFDFFTG
ncbi:MAG: zinc ribbon domain-containing protein [Vicinamibacterales bacterium]|jgi:hypothetical protein|nr:zinc ribbon domain-containing protein [Vicinamibacterales bacterium]MDP7480810.1 zinc ribbon domain-containing protein [Vicinamibacterales bacterium]HJN43125.1 zinc ribbon domain-containing protein [Vicinamibacterales bacterium]|tara:strand:+ start:3900 stop:4121 length:222 start_codon:yes stop_codon:yes gene_type:complete